MSARGVKRTIVFRVRASDAQRDEYRRILIALKQLEADKKALLDQMRGHADIATALRLANYSSEGLEIEPSTNPDWVVRASIMELIEDHRPTEPEKPAKPYVQPLHLDPKTLNLLLNAKVLTDQEKRNLVARLAPDLIKPEAQNA